MWSKGRALLIQALKREGISKSDAAREVGCSFGTFRNYGFRGQKHQPPADWKAKVRDRFGVPVESWDEPAEQQPLAEWLQWYSVELVRHGSQTTDLAQSLVSEIRSLRARPLDLRHVPACHRATVTVKMKQSLSVTERVLLSSLPRLVRWHESVAAHAAELRAYYENPEPETGNQLDKKAYDIMGELLTIDRLVRCCRDETRRVSHGQWWSDIDSIRIAMKESPFDSRGRVQSCGRAALLRVARQESNERVSQKLGVSAEMVSWMISGARQPGRWSLVDALAEHYGIPPRWWNLLIRGPRPIHERSPRKRAA